MTQVSHAKTKVLSHAVSFAVGAFLGRISTKVVISDTSEKDKGLGHIKFGIILLYNLI